MRCWKRTSFARKRTFLCIFYVVYLIFFHKSSALGIFFSIDRSVSSPCIRDKLPLNYWIRQSIKRWVARMHERRLIARLLLMKATRKQTPRDLTKKSSQDAVRKQFRHLAWRKPDWNNSTFQSTIKKSSLIYFSFPNFFFLLFSLVCASARVLQRFINCCSFFRRKEKAHKKFPRPTLHPHNSAELLKILRKISLLVWLKKSESKTY